MTLADQFNDKLLMAVPRFADGRPERPPLAFDSYFVHVPIFESARDQSRPILAARTVQIEELVKMKKALEDNRPVAAPAGIPGYDLAYISGDRLINFSRPLIKLRRVWFSWHPPMPIGKDPDTQEVLMSEGFIQQNVELQLIRCLTPRVKVRRLVKEALVREGAATERPLKGLQISFADMVKKPQHEEDAA